MAQIILFGSLVIKSWLDYAKTFSYYNWELVIFTIAAISVYLFYYFHNCIFNRRSQRVVVAQEYQVVDEESPLIEDPHDIKHQFGRVKMNNEVKSAARIHDGIEIKRPTADGVLLSKKSRISETSSIALSSLSHFNKFIVGGGKTQICFPIDISFFQDTENGISVLCVSEKYDHRVQLINYETGEHIRFIGNGQRGSSNTQFNYNHGIDVHFYNNRQMLFIADYNNHRVQVLDALSGEYIRTIGNGYGNDIGQFSCPTHVHAYSSSVGQLLFVSDSGNNRIQVFDAINGKHIRSYGKGKGCGNGQLNGPRGLVVFSPGSVQDEQQSVLLFVSDYHNQRVVIFDVDTGEQVRCIGGSQCPRSYQLLEPWGLALHKSIADERVMLYVGSTDSNSLVQVFDAMTGEYLKKIGTSIGSACGQLSKPAAVCIAVKEISTIGLTNGIPSEFVEIVCVADCGNDRVHLFSLDGNFTVESKRADVSTMDKFKYASSRVLNSTSSKVVRGKSLKSRDKNKVLVVPSTSELQFDGNDGNECTPFKANIPSNTLDLRRASVRKALNSLSDAQINTPLFSRQLPAGNTSDLLAKSNKEVLNVINNPILNDGVNQYSKPGGKTPRSVNKAQKWQPFKVISDAGLADSASDDDLAALMI